MLSVPLSEDPRPSGTVAGLEFFGGEVLPAVGQRLVAVGRVVADHRDVQRFLCGGGCAGRW